MPIDNSPNSEIGGGPAGGAGQVHADPHSEFAGAEHTHTMSPLEIGLMVGVIVVFGTIIGSLFFYRARKIKKMQADAEAGSRPVTKDGVEGDKDGAEMNKDGVETEDKEVVKDAAEASSGSFRQLFGRKWLSPKGGSKVDDVPLERV